MNNKTELKLKFDKTQMRIMKQRKNICMRKNKFKELNWEEFFWYLALMFGDRKFRG